MSPRPGLLAAAGGLRRRVAIVNGVARLYTPVPPGYRNELNTGVPAGTILTPYTGPTTITTNGTVLDGISTTSGITIQAENVVIRNSKISGVYTPDDYASNTYSVLIQRCEINANGGDAVEHARITMEDCDLYNMRRGVNGWYNVTVRRCIIRDNHTDATPPHNEHQSCIRLGLNTVVEGCTLVNATNIVYDVGGDDAGPSAELTGYGDFATVENCIVRGNYFAPTDAGFAAYGGYGGGKPFPDANRIRFVGNLFGINPGAEAGRKATGYYGTVSNWPGSNTAGNVFERNYFTDGTLVTV